MSIVLGDMYSSFHFILPVIQQGGIFPVLEIKLFSVERVQRSCPRAQKLIGRPRIQTKLSCLCLKLYFFPVLVCHQDGTRTRIQAVWLEDECPGHSTPWSRCYQAVLLLKANLTHFFKHCPHHLYFKCKYSSPFLHCRVLCFYLVLGSVI